MEFAATKSKLWLETRKLSEFTSRAKEFAAIFYIGGFGREFSPFFHVGEVALTELYSNV
jgi:hypothetical protein